MNKKTAYLLFLLIPLLISNFANSASIRIGEGSFVDFGGAQISSASLSLENSGEVDFGTSQILLTDLSNQANAMMNAASSMLSITGNWFNGGDFDAMSSSVLFVDGASLNSLISGQTTFNELIATSNTGKILSFEAGSEQSVVNNLELLGIDGNLLTIVSSNPGDQARLSLYRDASQLIDYVNVTDNYGVWQLIAPGSPANYNSVQGTNVRGWFGTPLQFPVPSLSFTSLLLLAATILLLFLFTQRKSLVIKGSL